MGLYLRLLLIVLAFCASCATQSPSFDAPLLSIPKRSLDALSGSAFGHKLLVENEQGREQAIVNQFHRGNIPDFLRHFSKVSFISQTRSGKKAEVTLWVLPDYLGVGSDKDFLRTPMTPLSAQ